MAETLRTVISTNERPLKVIENSAEVRPRFRHTYAVAAALAIVGGCIPRSDNIARSLWAAEAWVANSVLSRTWHGMFYYDNWLQTTPPLFLVLVRASVECFGLSAYSLRAVPFLMSIAALMLIARLARKMFSPPFAVLCIALMALSPSAILYSKELKQYSGDVFATCVILLALWNYLQNPDRRRYIHLIFALAAMLILSYTAVVFVPLAVFAVGSSKQRGALAPDGSERLFRCGFLGLLASSISGVEYILFIKPNTSPLLNNFWESGFPHFSHFGSLVRFYLETFLAMGVYFYFPAQSSTKDTLKVLVLGLPTAVHLLLGIFIFVAAVILAAAMRKDRSYRLAVLFFVMPFLTLFTLNLAHLYPVGSRRLTLFMLPSVVIVTTAAVEALWRLAFRPLLSESTRQRAKVAATALCVASVLVLGGRAAGWDVDWSESEDTESAFRYIRANVQASDTIYVHASVEEAAKLYFTMLRWAPANVRYGSTGLPCCKRQPELRPTDAADQRSYVVRSFDDTIKGQLTGSLWLVFTARSEHWEYLNLNEANMIQNRLQELGCIKLREQHFENELVDQFHCAGIPR